VAGVCQNGFVNGLEADKRIVENGLEADSGWFQRMGVDGRIFNG
jgi:hypothetical protein